MSQQKYEEAFRLAVQHHQAGRLAEAEAGYWAAMLLRPGDANPIQLLGVVLSQTGRVEEGVGLIRRAIAMSPGVAGYHSNLGFGLANSGLKEEAVAAFRQAVALGPNVAEAHANLANALRETGHLDEAIFEYQQSCSRQPPTPQMLNTLGLTLQARGRHAEAVACYQRAIALRADASELFSNLSHALLQTGKAKESEAAAVQAIQIQPGYAAAWYNRGNALQEQRRFHDAIDAYEKCLEFHPDFAEAHHNLGGSLREARRLDASLAHYRKALALGLDCFELRANLGLVLKDLGEHDEAINSFRHALELRKDPIVESNLLYTLHFHPNVDPAALRDSHAHWNERYARPLANLISRHLNDPSPDRRLRIGYVAPNLGNHPVGRFLLPLLTQHDRSQVEVFCYCDIAREDDTVSNQLRQHVDTWRTTLGMSDEQLAVQVQADRIDILVDLMMHVGNHRLLAFARKPAPVQVTYLAYPGTTGLDSIDYRFTDPYLDPPANTNEDYYSEKSIQLPHCFWCYPEPSEAPPVGPLPAGTSAAVTFGCLNSPSKLNVDVIATWSRLLATIPESNLILHCLEGSQRDRIAHQFTTHGISPARLRFIGTQSLGAYFAQYNQIDIALDPFPYPGGTTSCDALWMGVPVITLAGKTALSRGGVSILSNVGLEHLIASSTGDYVQIAAALARDLPTLQLLRSSLRDRMRRSPLMNAPRFASDVEAAYRSMWRKWCTDRQQPTASGHPAAG
ncbi:MAG TPA: tetratricopeptide repeat protein [Tepidisphaeraceae bacterium]|jgi:predicted O-linked N-acetylglucosamine transferase (SPINDLY family)